MTIDATGRVILVADDDPDDRMFAREALTAVASGLDIREVADGIALLEYLRDPGPERPFPDLVLLDLKMPRMNGFEALAEVRADPTLRHLAVVAVYTTATDPEFVRRTYALGANAFLGKPTTHEGMVTAMRVVVEHWFTVASLPPRGLGPEGP
ncbi:MAG: response regulator [Chloroflexota bacterium]